MSAKNRTKNNARTAWKEMSKMVGLDKEETAVKEAVMEETKTEMAPAVSEPAVKASAAETFEEKAAEAPVPKGEPTVIAAGTVISGDVAADGDMTIGGKICGNVDCGGTIYCSGSVEGNITAQNVILTGASVKGDIKVKDSVQIDMASVTVGNVESKCIVLDGKMKGDLVISGMTKLTGNAVLLGDITTERLSICEGSRFCGVLKMGSGKDMNSVFGSAE